MRELCKDVCTYYIPDKNVNNCSFFKATIRDDDTVCYKIQFSHKKIKK